MTYLIHYCCVSSDSVYKLYKSFVPLPHSVTMESDEAVIAELDLGDPDPELLEWARRHLNENPETKCQVLSDFRDLIYGQGDVTPHRTDDLFLLRFLRARYFKLDSAYKMFVKYHDFKEDNVEWCNDIDLSDLMKIGADQVILVPPYRESTGRRILDYRIGKWNPEKYSVDEMFQATISLLEIAVMEQRAQILGGICIFDFSGLSMQQAWYLTPSIARKVLQLMVTSFPLRIHALHIVNQSYIFDVIFNVFKPFLNEEMKKRIFFHGENLDSLHQHINPKYLPIAYGGIHPDYPCDAWIMSCRHNEKIVRDLKALGYKDTEGEDIHGQIN